MSIQARLPDHTKRTSNVGRAWIVFLFMFPALLAGCDDMPGSVAGVWAVDADRQFEAMVEAAERDLGPLPAELKAGFRVRAETMICTYEFRTDGTVQIRFRTNPQSFGVEEGEWVQSGSHVVANVTKIEGPGTGASFDRELVLQDHHLVIETPGNRVRWYLRREPTR